jgi:hypothetical protein
MAMQSLYDVLKEKEVQLQELQRLLNEAQTVLNRVLELDAAMAGSARSVRLAPGKESTDSKRDELSPKIWSTNGSAEFP